MVEQVAVFIDYQNAHLVGHGLYMPFGSPAYESLVDPLLIGQLLVEKRSVRFPSELSGVHVFRGRPNPEYQGRLTAANDAQTARWERDKRVTVVRRDMNYRGWPAEKPREKGVDVALAIRLVQSALHGDYDVAIVFTNDFDLLPAGELAYYETTPRVEIASWSEVKPLWFPSGRREGKYLPYCHFLNSDDFLAVRDHTPYL